MFDCVSVSCMKLILAKYHVCLCIALLNEVSIGGIPYFSMFCQVEVNLAKTEYHVCHSLAICQYLP